MITILAFSHAYAEDIYEELRNRNKPPLTSNNLQNTGNNNEQIATKNTPPTMRDEAFKSLVNKTFPLTPDQILELRRNAENSNAAVNTPVKAPPTPISSTLMVDLSPGSIPPVIRLATGFVSSIVFLDSTSKPWPVADFSLGNPQAFSIQWDNKTNTLFIQSLSAYASGNLAVRLAHLDTPIMLSLVTAQKDVDYRIDLQIKARGPNAEVDYVEEFTPISSNTTNNHLINALDGIAPTNSTELKVSSGHGRAWLIGNKLIFRTKLTLLSPAWQASIAGPDGTRVYEFINTPLILASQNGKPIQIEILGL